MPRKKISPLKKKTLFLKKKVFGFVTFYLAKIAFFYKRSEFNRGLVIGLGLTLVFVVGYTANAALPTTNDIENLNGTSYNELFPSGYLKPHEMKFFRYYVGEVNSNTSEVNSTIKSGANELVVFDDRADTDVNFEFFTNKINNAGNLDIDQCRSANQNLSGACGKVLKFSHKFYKHIEFYPDSRGTDIPPHMYFYEGDPVVKIYANDVIAKGFLPGAALSFFKKFDFDKLLDTKKADAAMSPITYENSEPDIPTSKKYFIIGKISDLITAQILDPKVFKSKSILEKSGTNSSYLFTAMTAEPKSKFINNAPTAYDYAAYFNTATINNLNSFYKKEIKKLTLKDNYSFNSETTNWTDISSNPVYRELKQIDLGGNKYLNEYFYNTSVSNFVNIRTSSLAGLVYSVGSSAGGFQHMYIYKGSGGIASTPVHNVSIRVGNISNNPCVYTDLPCQKTLEFEETSNAMTLSPQKKESLFAFLLPKKVNAQGWQYGEGGFHSLATANTSMKYLIQQGILSGHVFRPSWHFDMNNPKKATLYWKKEIVDHDYNENPVEMIPTLFQDLSKDGTGPIHTTDLLPILSYEWDRNYEDDSKGWQQTAGSMVSHDPTSLRLDSFDYQIKDVGTNDFKFLPKIITASGENLFISPNDDNILDNNPPSGKSIFIKACFTKILEDTCQNIIGLSPDTMEVKMQNYVIRANNVVFYDGYFNDWNSSGSYKYKQLRLKISIMMLNGVKLTEQAIKYVPIKLTPATQFVEPPIYITE